MNVLVTGGAGYVGTMLSARLLSEGHKVTILDNFMYGYEPILHLTQDPNLAVVQWDIRNDMNDHLNGVDVVFHLAAISGYPACEANPHSAQLINVEGTKKLVESLSNEQAVIYASTTSFYGKTEEVRTEKSEIAPLSMYGITKYEAEKIVMEKENAVSLRFATIFGVSPRMRSDLMLNDFVYKACTERSLVIFAGYSKRTFLHIQDVVDAYIFALNNLGVMKGEVFNVGSEELNLSKREIADKIREHVDFLIIDSELHDPDARSFYILFDKIEKLGYRYTRSIEDGIKELVKLYGFYKVYSDFRTI